MAPSCVDKDFLLPLCLPLAKSSHWERICCSGLTMPSSTRTRPWRRFADLRLAYHNRSVHNLNLFPAAPVYPQQAAPSIPPYQPAAPQSVPPQPSTPQPAPRVAPFVQAPPQPAPQAQAYITPPEPIHPLPPQSKKRSGWLVALLVVIGILLVFCIIPWLIIEVTNSYCALFPGVFNAIQPGSCP